MSALVAQKYITETQGDSDRGWLGLEFNVGEAEVQS